MQITYSHVFYVDRAGRTSLFLEELYAPIFGKKQEGSLEEYQEIDPRGLPTKTGDSDSDA
jgi:hypothetical protein